MISSRAHALVTFVNARLRHSNCENSPVASIRTKSESVDLGGKLNFRGPTLVCASFSGVYLPLAQLVVASFARLGGLQRRDDVQFQVGLVVRDQLEFENRAQHVNGVRMLA